MATIVKFEKCEGCGDCVETCPCGAIELKEKQGGDRRRIVCRLRGLCRFLPDPRHRDGIEQSSRSYAA